MDFTELTLGPDDEGRRLDHVLMPLLESQSRNAVFAALRKGLVKVNGKKANAQELVKEGDLLRIASVLLEKKSTEQKEDALFQDTFETVFENEHIRIINKPSGISVQPALHCEHSVSDIIAHTSKKRGLSLSFTPAPLHRLDKMTSGLLVISQSLKGASDFTRLIQEGLVRKSYLGITEGILSQKESWHDFIDDTLVKAPFYTVRVSKNATEGKEALTHAQPLACSEKKQLSLVQFDIETGRKHQIRAQTAFHGHALAGDTAYGAKALSSEKNGFFFLHAVRLRFEENSLGLPPEVCCRPPEHFQKFLKNNLLNWDGKLIL